MPSLTVLRTWLRFDRYRLFHVVSPGFFFIFAIGGHAHRVLFRPNPRRRPHLRSVCKICKGQQISKQNCHAETSPKKQTNQFVFPSCKVVTCQVCKTCDMSKHKHTQSIQLFRIRRSVCILREVKISDIFCFIFRDPLTFSQEAIKYTKTKENLRSYCPNTYTVLYSLACRTQAH